MLEAARALLPAGADPMALEAAAETVADATVEAEQGPGDASSCRLIAAQVYAYRCRKIPKEQMCVATLPSAGRKMPDVFLALVLPH